MKMDIVDTQCAQLIVQVHEMHKIYTITQNAFNSYSYQFYQLK